MAIEPTGEQAGRVARGYSKPGLILVYMTLSVASLALLVAYLFGFVQMTLVDRLLYYGLLLALFYCCIAYQLNRFGTAKRARSHRAAADDELAHLFGEDAATVAILIPSYREERRVLVMTMLSAALAQYSNRRIVLLVDDPPSDRGSISATLAAVAEVKRIVEGPMEQLRAAAAGWRRRSRGGAIAIAEERVALAAHYREAAAWLDDLAVSLDAEITPEFVHVDRFFIERIVIALAERYRNHAGRLVADDGLDVDRIALEYRRLGTLFCTDITSFERKRFDNLSHAANKAMNLNAYIGLMGGAYDLRGPAGRVRLEPAIDGPGELTIADATYVLTLDADSVILGNYILRLVDILDKNASFGVAQTPYLAFPSSAAAVERIAGATTDIQYLIHQGATFFNASYWVGANALIRFAALKQICREQMEADKSCRVYIQDETVIEDTGSTIDLLDAGWSVHNHFSALAYSATPGDFGALAIQRKRWSNGGLIIFPMLLRQYFRAGQRLRRLPELLLRSHYLLSPLIGNSAVFMLMIWASADGRALIFTPLVMLPYFTLYGTDLKRLGYRFSDILPVCALNLMLLPVSFAGIAASIKQMVTGRKAKFSRTPKVANRTFIPPYCFLFNSFMLLLMAQYVIQGVLSRQYAGTVIPAVNVMLYSYGLHRFLGFRNGAADLVLGLRHMLAEQAHQLAGAATAFGRALAGPRLVSNRALAAFGLSALVIFSPWHVGPSSSDGDLVGGAIASQTNGGAVAEPIPVVAQAEVPPAAGTPLPAAPPPQRPIRVTFTMDADASPVPASPPPVRLASIDTDVTGSLAVDVVAEDQAPLAIANVEPAPPATPVSASTEPAAAPAEPDSLTSAVEPRSASVETTAAVAPIVKPVTAKALVKTTKPVAEVGRLPPLPRQRPHHARPVDGTAAPIDIRPAAPPTQVQQALAGWKNAVASTFVGAAKGTRMMVVYMLRPGEKADTP